MFTGLVADIGTVEGVVRDDAGARISIATPVAAELAEGDSIAVSGVCLTATSLRPDGFDADVMNQTLELTTLGELDPGSPVNLEPALRASDRLGGHIVQGHVDAAGRVASVGDDGFARRVRRRASGGPRAIRGRARVDRPERGQPDGRRDRGDTPSRSR